MRRKSCLVATGRQAQCCAPFRFYVRVTLLPARRGLTVLKNSSIYWQRLPIITNNNMPMPANCAGDQPLPIIATGHLTTVGASKSDAVRDIYIGTLDAFPAQNFPPADYIALGHIHRAQIIGGMEHVRYCGSPIPLSFDECGKSKYVHLVTFSNGKLESVENLNVPVTQPMAVLKGDLASITAQLEQWRDVSQEPPVWLDIEITTDEYLHDIQRKIQALTESLPVEVLLVLRSREQRERVLASQQRETLSELSVEEVFNRRLALEELDESQQQRLQHLFTTTLHTLAGEHEA
ncbi:exonuclease SbcD [Escherichia coli]|uniref:Nuclease SbcCD subunit D n=1 Tax=Escherichia coli TaxID=562 RepID=A0A376RNA5_ECOLX|nr:exonuclease SbcD [Escherichia coli]